MHETGLLFMFFSYQQTRCNKCSKKLDNTSKKTPYLRSEKKYLQLRIVVSHPLTEGEKGYKSVTNSHTPNLQLPHEQLHLNISSYCKRNSYIAPVVRCKYINKVKNVLCK